MDDSPDTLFFQHRFPSLVSDFDDSPPLFRPPQGLIGSSPCLQALEMINCWRPLSVDTPTLKVVSSGCIVALDETNTSDGELIQWLRCRQSLVSLPSAYFTISLGVDNTVNPISMENLKELTPRNVGSFVVSRYLQYPSIGTGTTLRTAPFTQMAWSDRWSRTTTAMDRSGGSVPSLVAYRKWRTSRYPELQCCGPS